MMFNALNGESFEAHDSVITRDFQRRFKIWRPKAFQLRTRLFAGLLDENHSPFLKNFGTFQVVVM